MYDLAWGPKIRATSWPIYYVNGYKFHTDNTGVFVRGDTGDGESDWHGVINKILELEYPNEPVKRLCYLLVNDII